MRKRYEIRDDRHAAYANGALWRLALFIALLPFGILCSGCVSNTATRFNADGTPWDTSRTTFFLAKAQADNFEQSIKEAKGGMYEKTTKIKKPGVESQIGELMGAMAQLVSLVEKLMAKQAAGGAAP